MSDPARVVSFAWEVPTGINLLERIRMDAEVQSVGRSRFVGSLAQRNKLWLSYRNFLRQAISNFRAALTVDNRSASLLYYYAMLNMAKAELLTVTPTAVSGFVGHGLSANVTAARTVSGDSLTVKDGVFRMLYEHRTGHTIPVGTRLPVPRLLRRVPEIGEQLAAVGGGQSSVEGVLQLIASDNNSSWALLAVSGDEALEPGTATGRYFAKYFRPVSAPPEWRDRFGVSRRWGAMAFYESIATFPFASANDRPAADRMAAANTWNVKDVLALTTIGMFDAWLSPSLYKTKMLPMPPSLARYALSFYASSLVRYRPSMFDAEVFPDQAYLFDSIAREAAVPMLIDTISALTGSDYMFLGEDGLRL